MALVREYKTRLGVTVRIMDDDYAGISAEELARRRRQISDAINRIADNAQRRADLAAQQKGGVPYETFNPAR